MILDVFRFGLGRDSSLSTFAIDNEEVCWSLEDERRLVKVAGETCIPEGSYEVGFHPGSRFDPRYQKRYPEMHRGMLWVMDVPGFEGILIHQGNDDEDTAGCILVGMDPVMQDDGEFVVYNSAEAYKRIYPLIAGAIEDEERVILNIQLREPE